MFNWRGVNLNGISLNLPDFWGLAAMLPPCPSSVSSAACSCKAWASRHPGAAPGTQAQSRGFSNPFPARHSWTLIIIVAKNLKDHKIIHLGMQHASMCCEVHSLSPWSTNQAMNKQKKKTYRNPRIHQAVKREGAGCASRAAHTTSRIQTDDSARRKPVSRSDSHFWSHSVMTTVSTARDGSDCSWRGNAKTMNS